MPDIFIFTSNICIHFEYLHNLTGSAINYESEFETTRFHKQVIMSTKSRLMKTLLLIISQSPMLAISVTTTLINNPSDITLWV